MPAFFDLSGVRYGYGAAEDVIPDLTLCVAAGEMAAIIGPNGAGKSTLLRLMNGLLAPSAGEARIEGQPAAAMDPRLRARRVAFVPQAARVLFPYTVAEIVAMGRHPHVGAFGEPTPEDRERVAWAMDATGTAPFAGRLFSQLSGGEAQRVVLARALAQDAPALLLDEPTASLDLRYQAVLRGLLERLHRERGLTVVLVTHDINLAADFCPRLIALSGGRIVADGPPEKVVEAETIARLYDVDAGTARGFIRRGERQKSESAIQNPESGNRNPPPVARPTHSGFWIRNSGYLFPLLLLFALLLALKIGGGAVDISWSEIAQWMAGRTIDPMHADVLWTVRLPRVLMAALAGGVLACSGVLYQALLRNPLADPYTLGVSGGATLGAVLAISFAERLGANALLQTVPVVTFAALGGALISILLITALARSWGIFSSATLILAGVTLNMIFASLILLIEYFADFTQVYQMIRWMMGGLDVIGYRDFRLLAPLALLGIALAFAHRRDLDLLAVDPVSAAAMGVRVGVVRRRLLLAASLMTGAVVACAGPIGFVGLVIPHAVRLLSGAEHRRVLPGSIFAGAIFLLASDTVAQNLLGVNEVPVGVITSMVGGPVFVLLLFRRSGRASLGGD